jgi:hypothetical protein
MSEKPTAVGVVGGALGLSALALAFGVCCVSPWAVTTQLPGLDNQKFPPWNAKIFAKEVNETLAASNGKN